MLFVASTLTRRCCKDTTMCGKPRRTAQTPPVCKPCPLLPDSYCRVHDIENNALVGAHTANINTISFSTMYRCMATGGADGYIVIWDLEGQQLHAIHLQVGVLVCSAKFLAVAGLAKTTKRPIRQHTQDISCHACSRQSFFHACVG